MRFPSFCLLSLLLTHSLGAQVYTPPAKGSTSSSGGVSQDRSRQADNEEADSPYGNEVPLLDSAAESITIAGVTIPLGDSRLVKARFEKYLNEPPEDSDSAQQYRKNIDQILELVSPFRHSTFTEQRGSSPSLTKAFALLPKAASYPGDARLCATLAESVYTAMLAKKDSANLRSINRELEEEKKRVISAGDSKARNNRAPVKTDQTKVADGAATTETITPGAGMTSLEYADYLRRITEIEALKKTNLAKTEAGLLASKAQFQASMIQWFLQRRFQHVLMASRFYNQIWRDGDAVLRFEEGSDVAEVFSGSLGTTPTVTTLDTLASEAIRDAEKAVGAFNYLLEKGELHNASQRLLEAFAVGEYLTPIATLSLDKKREVQGYFSELNLLHDAMKVRDYTKAKILVDSLKKQAKDFPAAKADAAIAGYTLASDLAIEDAKANLLGRDRDGAKEAIQEATELWPTNPKLDEFRTMVGSTSELAAARNNFDRLLSEKNYREIMKRAEEGEFILAVRGDENRTTALNEIRDSIREIEVAISKAEEFSRIGAEYSAYEQLARIRERFPDDPKLGRQIELLAPQVADFTKALDQADKLKNRREPELGSALAHYLEAQAIFPESEIAAENIDTLMEDIPQL
jgi:hypothetical protein